MPKVFQQWRWNFFRFYRIKFAKALKTGSYLLRFCKPPEVQKSVEFVRKVSLTDWGGPGSLLFPALALQNVLIVCSVHARSGHTDRWEGEPLSFKLEGERHRTASVDMERNGAIGRFHMCAGLMLRRHGAKRGIVVIGGKKIMAPGKCLREALLSSLGG